MTALQFVLHSLLGLTHESYNSVASESFQSIASSWRAHFSFMELQTASSVRRANATLVMLARNKELEEVVFSMKQLEDRFNRKYNYPWVFLNDEPFTDEFKK
jgi:alpha 1,2-mannosyltransferase